MIVPKEWAQELGTIEGKIKGYTKAKHIQSHSQGKKATPILNKDECLSGSHGNKPQSPPQVAGLVTSFPAKAEDTKTILESMGVDYSG